MAKAFPEAFKKRMAAQLGAEYDEFIAAYDMPPVRGIRVNTLKLDKERFIELCPWKIEQSPTLNEGMILRDSVEHIGSHPFHIAGMFYVQEPSAMSVIEAAEIAPGMRVLDLCAAPGGKSGGIAARLQRKGFLLSNEIVPSRAKQLARNLERLGVVNAAVSSAHPDTIASALPRYFDRVIVDAPCSGEGMFRKDNAAIAEWSEEHVLSCAARQKAILETAEKCVAEGGRLVYSTCTFSPEENEGVIDAFMNLHPDYSLVSNKRFYPHTCAGEGHFVAVLEKGEAIPAGPVECSDLSLFDNPSKSAPARSARSKDTKKQLQSAANRKTGLRRLNREQSDIAFDFLSQVCVFENGCVPTENLFVFSDKLLCIPFELPSPALNLHLISLGFEVGEFARGRLKPSHTFFMAAHCFKYRNRVCFDENSNSLAAFLRGEALDGELFYSAEIDIDGEYSRYFPVCVRSLPVGFCKLSDGILKNHLPKGLIGFRSCDTDDK